MVVFLSVSQNFLGDTIRIEKHPHDGWIKSDLEKRHVFVFQIGDEHVAGGVGDHQWQGCGGGRQGRGNPAGPEHRNFARFDGDRVAEIRAIDVLNADLGRIADMDRCAVGQVETGGDLDRADGLLGRHRPHADNQGGGKRAGRRAGALSDVHGNVFTLRDVSDRNSGGLQGVLKGETAAQKEADHVFSECVGDGFDFFRQLSLAVDPVAGQILTQIGPGGNFRLVYTGLENIEYWTGFGVADTEEKKVKGFLLRQHDQVGLNKAAGRARGRFSPLCGANPVPQLGRSEVFWGHGVFLRIRGLAGLARYPVSPFAG
jgi:hypothetical protein